VKLSQFVLIVLLSAAVAFGAASYAVHHAGSAPQTAPRETAFERVTRTGVLRCGYFIFPPIFMRDPNTNTLSGLSVDMMTEMAKNAGLKIDWTEEVDFGTWPAGLKAGRFDAVCGPIWPDVALAREVLFTHPMFYAGIYAYARGDDRRFDNNLAAINDPSVTIAVIEGNAPRYLAQALFPKARLQTLPQNAQAGTVAEYVATKKADILFWDENGVHDFLKANPGSLHNVDPAHPLKAMPFELAIGPDNVRLQNLLNVGLQGLEDTGAISRLLDKWERAPGDFYRLAKPYIQPQ
jgi:ABC-type amino acid transport substrate-binding protein